MIGPVDNYQQMLNRLGKMTGGYLFLVLIILNNLNVAWLPWGLQNVGPEIEAWGFKDSIATVVASLVTAIVFSMTKMHDKISTLLKIRYRFDTQEMLDYYLHKLNLFSVESSSVMAANRVEAMRSLFYNYASSGEGQSKIDRHLISSALRNWTWYWGLLESLVADALVVFLVMVANDDKWTINAVLIISYFVASTKLLLMDILLKSAVKNAHLQIDAILDIAGNRTKIEGVMNEILSQKKTH